MSDQAGDVKGVTCFCYFRGRDGLGTCNTLCQWATPIKHGQCCPMWTPQEKWNTEEDHSMNATIEEYEKVTGSKITVLMAVTVVP